MNRTRRQFLIATGGGIAALGFCPWLLADGTLTIAMRGTARGARVWFDPLGLAVPADTSIRFVNRDAANSHTATTYHPRINDRARRIPAMAEPWNSGFLMPEEVFEVHLNQPGVYDYYCIPHERAGMVGRIVVGTPDDDDWDGISDGSTNIPAAAASTLPEVDTVLRAGRIESEGAG